MAVTFIVIEPILKETLLKLKAVLNTHRTPPTHLKSSGSSNDATFDSGASGHYLTKDAPVQSKTCSYFGPIVHLPEGNTMKASHDT